jgi:cytidylate kinase
MDAVPVIAIDGPSGAGKGTVSRMLADRLHWHLLDSGALYRLVALAGRQGGLAAQDIDSHAQLARTLDIRFQVNADGTERVLLEGRVVTDLIRTEEAGMGASRVAAWPAVRTALLARQRAFAAPPGLVADGRDMGTVVFATAALKIFLTATADERAQRRYKQLKDKGSAVNLAALLREIADRDRQDSNRAVAPLVPAGDAVILDSTGHSAAEMTEAVLRLAIERRLCSAVAAKA